MTQNIVDQARMKRVVEQTVERIRTDAQFRGIIQQTMTAAHDRNQHTAATNVALILVQALRLTELDQYRVSEGEYHFVDPKTGECLGIIKAEGKEESDG